MKDAAETKRMPTPSTDLSRRYGIRRERIAAGAAGAPFRPGDDVSVPCPIRPMAFFRHDHRLPDQPELPERGQP